MLGSMRSMTTSNGLESLNQCLLFGPTMLANHVLALTLALVLTENVALGESPQGCPQLPHPEHGHVVCEDDEHNLVGSQCTFSCAVGFLPDGGNGVVICTYDNATSAHAWHKPETASSFSCSESVGIVVGGQRGPSQYLQSVEVFSSTQPQCHSQTLNDFPHKVVGPVSAFIGGFGIVCGGATTAYVDCTEEAGGGKVCDRNVEYVQTPGGTRWYDGPRTKECHYFDHKLTRTWRKAVDLQHGRVYASGVTLPDGQLWILGGLGTSTVLDSTEIVGRHPITQAWYVKPGLRRLPKRRFGHCAVLIDHLRVSVIGGFVNGDYSSDVETFHLKDKIWTTEPTGLREARLDLSCTLTRIRSEPAVVATGGWNQNGLISTSELMKPNARNWELMGGPGDALDFKSEMYDRQLRRSGQMYGDSDVVMMVGGVACGPPEAGGQSRCTQTNSALKYVPHATDSKQDKWELVPNLTMTTPRSSHTLLYLPMTQVCP